MDICIDVAGGAVGGVWAHAEPTPTTDTRANKTQDDPIRIPDLV